MITWSKTVVSSTNIDGKPIQGTGSTGSAFVPWSNVTGTPTTIAGYGFTSDFNSKGDARWSLLAHNHSGVYEPVDSHITRDNVAETITSAWEFANDVKIDAGATDKYFVSNSNSGRNKGHLIKTGDVLRWAIKGNSTTESGSDAGTDLDIQAFTDAGGSIGNALRITRATLAATFGATVTATNFIDSSDKRLKTNIKDFCACKFDRVKFRKFKLKSDPKRWQYGVIADELKEVYPELVYEDDKGYLGVDYRALNVIGLQKLQEEILGLKRLKKMNLWQWLKYKLNG